VEHGDKMRKNARIFKQTKVGKYTLTEHTSSTVKLRQWALPGGKVIPNDRLFDLKSKLSKTN
jgi:hypothetical protein